MSNFQKSADSLTKLRKAFSVVLIVGSLVGIGFTVGWIPSLCLFTLLWGNNLEQRLTRGY